MSPGAPSRPPNPSKIPNFSVFIDKSLIKTAKSRVSWSAEKRPRVGHPGFGHPLAQRCVLNDFMKSNFYSLNTREICYLFLRLGNYPLAIKSLTKFLKIARGRAGMVYLNSKKIIRIKKQNTKICRCRRKHSNSARDVKIFCPKCNTFTVYSSEMIKSKLHAVLFRNDRFYPTEGGVSNSIFHVGPRTPPKSRISRFLLINH